MVKRLIILVILCFIIEGCIIAKKNSYGSLRVGKIYFKNLDVSKNLINTTETIYQIKADFFYSKKTKEYSYYQQIRLDEYSGTHIRFYENGKISYFYLSGKSSSFSRESFDPKKGKMGYYGEYKGKIYFQMAYHGDGGALISKDYLTIYQDSIVLIDKWGIGSTYVPVKVPKEYLENWDPDW